MIRIFIYSLLAILALNITPSEAAGKKKKENREKKEEKLSKYDKLFKDKDVITRQGMVTLHLIDKKKLYMEFPLQLLGREFLLGSKIVETSDQGQGIVGLMGEYPFHISFSMADSTILMHEVSRVSNNLLFSDSEEENVQEGIRKNSISPIINAFPALAYNNDSTAVVFDMTTYFTTHNENMTPFCYGKRAIEYNAGQSVKFKDELSYLVDIKAFDDNVSIISCLSYWVDLVTDGRYILS